jgi:hypothetical protein
MDLASLAIVMIAIVTSVVMLYSVNKLSEI